MKDKSTTATAVPPVTDRSSYQSQIDSLRIREKQHKKEGDALAAARRRLPMVEVDGTTSLIGERGPVTLLEAFEGRRMLVAYYYMWHHGHSAADQCEGCALYTAQVREVSLMQSRDITYATFCQAPYEESARYRKFMGWDLPWYAVQGKSLETLLAGRRKNVMYLICYLRQGSTVFETYWTTGRGVEVMGNNYPLMDLTVYGRQEWWEDSPKGWPQPWLDVEGNNPYRIDGRPIVQWPRVRAGFSDDLGKS